MASPALAAFTVGIGFEADEQSARRTANSFDMLKKKALSLGSVLAGAFGFKAVTTDFAQRVDAAAKFGDLIGVSADRLTAWDRAAQHAGLTAGAMTGEIENMHNVLSELNSVDGAGIMEAMAKAGLDPNIIKGMTNEMDALLNIAAAVQGMTPEQRTKALSSVGIGGMTGAFLAQGPSSIRAQVGEERVRRPIKPGDAAAAAEFNKQMQNLLTNLGALADVISRTILPPITSFLGLVNSAGESAKMVSEPTAGSRQIFPGVFISKNKPSEAQATDRQIRQPYQVKGVFNLNGKALGEVITEAIEGKNSLQLQGDGSQ